MTDARFFVEDPDVGKAVRIAQQCADKQLSDLVDDAGHQYVDLVMEGGGVLGIALVGYTYVLEQAGVRFLGVGGTSAGSINALMIAALGTPDAQKSARLVEILANMPMEDFIDGDGDAQDFSRAVIEKAGMIKLLWKAAQIMDNLRDDLGLNPGNAFLRWLTKELEKAGIRTNADLRQRLNAPAGLRIRTGIRNAQPLEEHEKCGHLAMVAADITTETKVEFPKMAQLYWAEPDKVNPADFARASMSIPFFFQPYRVENCPQGTRDAWAGLAGYSGPLPQTVMFMDGGIMSNFPINLFHEPYSIPLAPTFGVKIGIDRSAPNMIKKPAQLVEAIFDAARHTLDDDFVVQNPDYRQLVAMIDTAEHGWLNFDMKDDDKLDLFRRGAATAAEFLCNFDWGKYKETRRGIADAFQKGGGPTPAGAGG